MMVTKTRKITPAIAAQMLDQNHLNTRPRNKRRVFNMAQVMKKGGWRLTHQGIALDDDGNVLDGQHRLNAVVESGVTVEMNVTTGVDPSVFAVLDVGRPRTVGDVLSIAGYANSSLLGSVIRMVHTYQNVSTRPWNSFRSSITPDDIQTVAQDYGDTINVLLPQAARIRQRINGSTSAYAAALFIIQEWALRHDKGTEFEAWADGLESGVGLEEGDARLALASWVNGAAKTLHGSIRAEVILMAMLRCFDAHIRGEKLQKIFIKNPVTWFYRLPA
jgi:hypothetical protein